jgi:hypothetical protein
MPRMITDISEAFDVLQNRINDLNAELALIQFLTFRLLGLMVRKAQNPERYFAEIRESSRENLATNLRFESGEAEANQEIVQKALERHEQMFEEMSRALGFRKKARH